MTAPKPEIDPPAAQRPFDDRGVMAVGILGFGLSIPLLTGLYGPHGPGSGVFWFGFCWFIGLAAAIWGGNRWLLFRQREHFDWFNDPWRKLVILVSANVLFTAPVTLAALWIWYRAAGLAPDAHAMEVVTLTNVICVIFVTHAYETVFLIRERQSDLLRVERLERLRAQAELEGLKAQIDPHFLFNSLNTLGHLIPHDPAGARSFCDALAQMYRYVLASRSHDSVPLAHELEFVRMYHRLLALRFGDDIVVDTGPALATARCEVAPMALQTLVENAVKHNQLGGGLGLTVRLDAVDGHVLVSNRIRERRSAQASTGLGLRMLDERCRALTGRGLAITRDNGMFTVAVPWVPSA